MDNLTHTLFALTLARTPLNRAGRGTAAALVIASNAPDVDAVTLARSTLSYIQWHRGPTHGALGVAGLGLLTAALVWSGRRIVDRRWPHRRPAGAHDASFRSIAAVSILGVLLHVLMDLPTAYGTRLLSPLDWHWYALDWLPIIDLLLLTILIACLISIHLNPGAARRVTALALALMASNYGLRAVAHHQALAAAPHLFGPALPERCLGAAGSDGPLDSWPRPLQPMQSPSGRPCLVEIAAMPTFLSPFRWRVIAQLSNAYELHDIDLFAGPGEGGTESERFWRMTVRYPNQWTARVHAAATTEPARVFLGFSRFPAARSMVDSSGTATVRWNDIRFAGGVVSLSSPPRRREPFALMIRLAADGSLAGWSVNH